MFAKEAFAQHPVTGTNPIPIGPVAGNPGQFGLGYDSLGAAVSLLVVPAFSIAAMMVVVYFLIAAFELITSQGDKAHIVSARAKIYHAIIGLILLLVLFLFLQYVFPAIGLDPILFRII